jgi:hypothetical protein
VIRKTRIATLLARAKEAEEQAARAKDPAAREQWLKIAEDYRQLAMTA